MGCLVCMMPVLILAVSTASVNTKFSLDISPTWVMSHEFVNVNAVIYGKLQMMVAWRKSPAIQMFGAKVAQDLRTVPVITNFVGGRGAVLNAGPNVDFGDWLIGSRFYVGGFKQLLDEACYPFDHIEAKFNIGISGKFSDSMDLGLHCGCETVACPDECEAYDSLGNPRPANDTAGVVKIVRKNTILASVGFDWEEFICKLQSGKLGVVCTMKGVRDWELIVLADLVTGVVMLLVAYLSVWMPPGGPFAMPRIATTMIAMLTFIAKGTAVMEKAPQTGGLSWLGHFFVAGVVLMLITMLSHIRAFLLGGHEHRFMRIFNRYSSFPAYILFLFAELHGRSCAHLPEAASLLGCIVFTIISVASLIVCCTSYRPEIEYFLRRDSQKKDDPSDGKPKLNHRRSFFGVMLDSAEEEKKDVSDQSAKEVGTVVSEVEIRFSDVEAQCEKKIAALAAQLQESEARRADAEARCANAESRLAQRQTEQGSSSALRYTEQGFGRHSITI